MNIKARLPWLMAICILGPSSTVAADLSPYLNGFKAAITTMDQCAKIANLITALKPPPGHAEAVMQMHINKNTQDPRHKAEVHSAHETFAQQATEGNKQLEQCGVAYQRTNKPVEGAVTQIVDAMEKRQLSEQEGQTMLNAITQYHESKDKLGLAIHQLTDDKIVQSYVHKTLLTYFFGFN